MPRPDAAEPGATRPDAAGVLRTVPGGPTGGPVDRAEVSGPEITDDEVVFRLPDEGHHYDGVRLEVDWVLGGVDPEFVWAAGRWSLRLPRPDAWRLEYQLTVRRGGDCQWTTDPGNPRRVPNPFGEKSEVRFPGYREPAWLMTAASGPLRKVETSAGRLTEQVPVQLWSPVGLSADRQAPLLLVHDGSDMVRRGSLLSWASAMSSTRPIRVALLDPAVGLRNDWYAADPDYADHLADVVLPALTARVLTGPVIGLGASLGAVSMLTLQRRHPGSISALALQSGSYFTPTLDAQESSFAQFEQICSAVRRMSSGPDLTAVTAPRPVPVLMTCGAIEENLANNKLMAATLRRQGHPVTIRVVPDAHTMIGWRDAWSPELDDLVGALR